MTSYKPVSVFLSAFTGIGGIQRFNQSLISSLTALSLKISLFVLNDPAGAGPGKGFGRNKIRFLINAIVKRNQSTINIIGHVNLLPVLFLLRSSSKSVLIIHGIEVWKPLKKIETLALARVSVIWSVSNYSASRFRELNQNYSGEIRIVPNQLPPSFQLTNPEKAVNEIRVLTVTRLVTGDNRKKHVPELIQAVKKLVQSGHPIRYDLVTSGDDVPYHQSLISEDPLLSAVTNVHLNIDDAALKELYKQAHWFVLPSEKEGFGIVFLEAMANGCICIGGNAGGTPDVIQHMKNGFLVDFDAKSIDEQIFHLIHTFYQSEQLPLLKDDAKKSVHNFSHESVTALIGKEISRLTSEKVGN